jgi:hypothetical protein
MNAYVKERVELAIDCLVDALRGGPDQPPDPPKPSPLGFANIIRFPAKPPLYHPDKDLNVGWRKTGD